MTESDTRFAACFRDLFENGLEDIKLFLRPDHRRPSAPELRAELKRMQDVVAAKGTKRLHSIDRNIPKTRYDAPFD